MVVFYQKLYIIIFFILALSLQSMQSYAVVNEVLNVEVTGKLALCNHSERGEIILNVTGGVAPYTYQWSNGESTSIISDLNTGTYTVTITDQSGIRITKTIIIQPPFVLTTALENQKNASCDGNSDGAVDLKIIRGRQPFKIVWSHGLEDVTQVRDLSPGSYTVSVTDYYQCTNTIAFTIAATGDMEIESRVTNLICDGEQGSIELEIKGGEAPFEFNWSNGAATKDIKNLEAGIYKVNVMDAKGCSVEKTFKLTKTEAFSLEWKEKTDVLCSGAANGSAELSIKGGEAPFKIEWMDNTSIIGLTRKELKAGSYELRVEDANGCMVIESFEIKEPAPFKIKMFTQVDVDCSSAEAKGMAWIQVTGGQGPYIIKWNTGEEGVEEINFGSAGKIEVEVLDALGCRVMESREVNFPNKLAKLEPTERMIYLLDREEFMVEEPIRFMAKVPEDAIAWEWDFGNGHKSTELDPSYAYKEFGEFEISLTVHNIYGCEATESYRITVNDNSYRMMVPNAFSPNGDGLNDSFIPKWRNITAFEMLIFNTWGELLFTTTQLESPGWNGYHQGREAPRGNYIYRIKFITLKGEKKNRSGVFTLVK